jgi:translation initiation factor 2B subunit (eIF-2B alpha/beta/delta family)
MRYYHPIIGIIGAILAVFFATSDNLALGSLSSPEVENQVPEGQQISAQITQTREDIENELKKQGEILTNAIKQQFGFENVQSNLSQAYQDSFAGGLESAKNQVRSADVALEDSVISLLKSGQQLISASQNKSIVLDDNSRVILNNFGQTLSNLSITTNELQSQLSG